MCRFRTLGDADDEKGDDERDYRHFQSIQPQGPDKPGGPHDGIVDRRRQMWRDHPDEEPEDKGRKRPVSAKATPTLSRRLLRGSAAQRGFRNLNTKRSVLPRMLAS